MAMVEVAMVAAAMAVGSEVATVAEVTAAVTAAVVDMGEAEVVTVVALVAAVAAVEAGMAEAKAEPGVALAVRVAGCGHSVHAQQSCAPAELAPAESTTVLVAVVVVVVKLAGPSAMPAVARMAVAAAEQPLETLVAMVGAAAGIAVVQVAASWFRRPHRAAGAWY